MIHVSLEGIVKTEEDQKILIHQIQNVCERERIPFEIENHQGEIYLCPCGVIDVKIENYFAVLKTNTALAGPGYHVAVVELFDKIMNEEGVYLSMDDECDYLEDHDFERIKQMYFIPYMSQLMRQFSNMKEEDQATYGWDERSYLPVAKENTVITPYGYISGKQAGSYSIDTACQNFYIWNEIEKDAYFYRNSALVSLWCDCLFENSLYDEKSLNVSKSICDALEKAHELDPLCALPVDEYQQLCKLLHRKNKIFDVDQYPKGAVGYHREFVFYVYGNWFLYFQGNALQSFDGHTMVLKLKDEDEDIMTLKVTGYKNHEKMDFAYRYLNSVDALDSIDFENEKIHVKGVLHQLNDADSTLYLQAQCLKENELLMINVECRDMTSYKKALLTLENIQHIEMEKTVQDVRI